MSVAAAGFLASSAIASTSVNTVASQTVFSSGGDYNFTANDINITETLIAGVPSSTTATMTVTIPGTVQLSGTAGNSASDINTTNIVSGTAYLFVTANSLQGASAAGTKDSNASVWIDVNATESTFIVYPATDSNASLGIYKLFDVNQTTSGAVTLSADTNSSQMMLLSISGSTIDLNASSGISSDRLSIATSGTVMDGNTSKLALITKGSDNSLSFTLNLLSQSNSALDNLQISGLNLRPVAAGSGDVAIGFVGTSGISTHSVTVATLQTNAATLELNDAVLNSINAAGTTTQTVSDFNITLASNFSQTESDEGNITLVFTGATILDNNASITTYNTSGAVTGTHTYIPEAAEGNESMAYAASTTLVFDANLTGGTIISVHDINMTVTGGTGTAVTVDFYTSGNDRNFTSLNTYASTSTPLTIANIVTDGATVSTSVASVASPVAVIGGLSQSGLDVNVTESFITSFEADKTVTLTLPTGYTWASQPTVQLNNVHGDAAKGDANQTLISADTSSNLYTVTFANHTDSSSEGSVKAESNTSSQETLFVSGISYNVPTTAVNDESVTMTVSGTSLTGKTVTNPTVTIGTVKSTSATVTDKTTIGETTSTKVGLAETTAAGTTTVGASFLLNEAFQGTLQAGKTVSITLDNAAFSGNQGTTITTPLRTTSAITIGNASYSDSNKTATWTITAASTDNDQNITVYLPEVTVGSTNGTATTVTGTVGGTAGASGTVNVADFVSAVTTSAGAMPSLAAANVDVYTAEFTASETLKAGLSTTSNAQFRVIAPAGISFTGAYNYVRKLSGTASYGTFLTTAVGTDSNKTTTFNTNDTLYVQMPSTIVTTAQEDIKFKFKVNVDPTATDGLKTFSIKSGAGLSDETGVNLVYVGTVPTLTTAAAAVTVEAGKTTSVVPSNSTGTVTYASADTAIATVDTTGTVTVDANATEAATVVITATDSLTAQTASTTITVGAAVVVPDTLSGDITIGTGWNLVSSPVDGTVNSSVLNAVAQKSGTTAVVWPANSTGTNYGTMGEAIDMAPGQGAWVLADTAGTASFTGVTAATTAFSLATHVASLTAGGFGGGGYYLVGTPVATTFADVITAGAKIVWTFDTANNTYVGVNPAFAGQTGFDADGYYGGATSATAISAGSGFWYSAQ